MKFLRIAFVILSVALPTSAGCKRIPNIAKATAGSDPELKLASEIQLERIYSGCTDCDDHSLTLRRGGGDIFADATVIRTNLHTKQQREGKLSAYYYNHLIELIKSQGVIEMEDRYAMGWFDSLVVRMDISIGNRRKTIRTSNEGEVPLKLWGAFMAIDGAVARTKWNDALAVSTTAAQTKHSRFRPSKEYWDWVDNGRPASIHYNRLANGRTLVDVGDSLYLLNRRNRILWAWDSGGPPLNSPPFLDSSETIYITGADLTWVAIDAKTGHTKWSGTANGRASYSPIIPFKNGMYFVITYMGAYRRTPTEVVKNGVTLCRGNSILWTSEIPSDSRLRVRRGKAFLSNRRVGRTVLEPLVVPDKLDKPIGRVSALAPYD